MKYLKFSALTLLTLSACGQSSQNNKVTSESKSASKNLTAVYRSISTDFCNCISYTMRNKKPTSTLDSCYSVVLFRYTDSLKQLGIDPTTQAVQLKITNEIIGKLYITCGETYKLLQKEMDNEKVNKLFFTGTIISQKQLANGEIELVMKDTKTKESKTFKSKSFLTDPTIKDKNTLSYELTFEYEVRYTSINNKEEYYVKENASSSTISIQKVNKQK